MARKNRSKHSGTGQVYDNDGGDIEVTLVGLLDLCSNTLGIALVPKYLLPTLMCCADDKMFANYGIFLLVLEKRSRRVGEAFILQK